MTHSVKEKITIGWCDGGTVEGRFMSGITNTIIESKNNKLNIVNTIRVNGNQIARQRQSLWDFWADLSDSEWLLWVDSDIVLTMPVLKMLWDTADKDKKPVVTGVYFVSSQNEQSLMQPVPAIYNETGDPYRTQIIHPLPQNKVIPVDVAGFGLMLMHRSIIEPVRKIAGDLSVFGENQQVADKFISEDVSFCRKLKAAGIQLYAHTGATVQHMKTFSFDQNYYNLYWNGIATEFIKKPGNGRSESDSAKG
jgi:GT2 family glycosyltransferase